MWRARNDEQIMQTARLVTIIIVTCGIESYINSCLDSIKEQTYPDLEILVMDNSLSPDFSQGLNRRYSFIKLYPNAKNLFYSQALNKGIEISKGDFILCLNDDVTLDKNFISEALKGFDIDRRIGMVSGKVLRSDGKTIDSTGLSQTIFRSAKERGYGLKDKGQFEKKGHIFGVSGAVAFYLKEMLEDIREGNDYFDADFRIFYEDLDIALRASRFSWKGYYMPCAIAYHLRGGTVRLSYGIGRPIARRFLSNDLQLELIKNRYLCIIKNESWLDFLLHLPFLFLYDFMSYTYILLFRPRLIKSLPKLILFLVAKTAKRKISKI